MPTVDDSREIRELGASRPTAGTPAERTTADQTGFFRALFEMLHSWGYDRISIDAVVGHRKVTWRKIEGLSFSPSMLEELIHRYEATGEINLEQRTLPIAERVHQDRADEGSR